MEHFYPLTEMTITLADTTRHNLQMYVYVQAALYAVIILQICHRNVR